MASTKKVDTIKLFFEDRQETLKIINNGGNLYKYLTGKSTFCPLIGAKIKLTKVLGTGSYGKVFEIEFPGRGSKKYAVKRSEDQYFVPCNKQKSYPRLDGRGDTIVPKGSNICDMVFSEYAISLLVGELVRSETCINFIDTFAFSLCNDGPRNPYDTRNLPENVFNNGASSNVYIFMEQISSSVRKSIGCIMETAGSGKKLGKMSLENRYELTNSILIQTLFAVATYQKTYHIVHGDLHEDNIFYVDDPDQTWKGKRIGDYDYYQYVIKGAAGTTNIYIPAIPIIVKIGDFGLAVKYSKAGEPMIGDMVTLFDGYDQYDEANSGPWLPNFYSSAYDTTFITSIFAERNPSNEFVQSIAAWIFGAKPGSTKTQVRDRKNQVMSAGTGRPMIKELDGGALSHVDPEVILTSDLMGKYTIKPPNGSKILIIGSI